MNPHIVFMGSPEFSLPSLKKLAENYSVVGVITQPDRPAGRGRTLTPPPVKQLAQELGLDVFQPEHLKDPQVVQRLQDLSPDLIVVVAYGQILQPEVLDIPRWGCLNVHASLLPRWRGASPVQAAILHGDQETGVTIMQLDAGMDTGPVLSQRSMPVLPNDTGGKLTDRLAEAGADLLLDTLPGFLSGEITPLPQAETGMTVCRLIRKAEGELDLSQTAEALERRVRAFDPWPGTFILWRGTRLKIQRVQPAAGETEPGKRTVIGEYPALGTSAGWLVLLEVQPAGKKSMPGNVFLRGERNWHEH